MSSRRSQTPHVEPYSTCSRGVPEMREASPPSSHASRSPAYRGTSGSSERRSSWRPRAGPNSASTRSTRTGTLTFVGEYATLAFERRIPHPVQVVWEALTEPEHLARWYMTKAVIDGRTGGSIDFRIGPAQLHVTGRILVWEPPHVFEYEWKVKPWGRMPKGEDAIVRWELRPEGEETVLTLTHRNLTRRSALGAAPATHVGLERLVAQLAGQPV